jgi:hypothetical protein
MLIIMLIDAWLLHADLCRRVVYRGKAALDIVC